jgi:hypothetical protein
MAKKNKSHRPYSAFDIFINARAFLKATGVLATYNDDQFLMFPFFVSEAFTLELHLKCVHRLRRRYPGRAHTVKDLFESLSKADQKKIDRYLQGIIANHPNADELTAVGVDLDVTSILERSNDMFVRGRYWHEGLLPSPDSRGNKSNAGIAPLVRAVESLIFEIQPEWRAKINRVQFKWGQPPPPAQK